MRPWRRLQPALVLGGICLGAPGCAPSAASREGVAVSGLYEVFLGVAAVIFVTVAGLITWSIVRFRAKPGDEELPEQFHRNLKLELTWFAIPQIIVVVLFIMSALVLSKINAEAPHPTVTVRVEGYQWGWRFHYQQEDIELVGTPGDQPTIVLPVGAPIAFELTSSDVVHSFWVPRFLMKRDMVPGQTNRLDVTIEEPGLYSGACTEFCGLLHEKMSFKLRAVTAEQYETWVDQQQGAADGSD